MTKEHPILFTSESIRSILSGRKTQTRRIIKHHSPVYDKPENIAEYKFVEFDGKQVQFRDSLGLISPIKCPYGEVGNILWIKEAWTQWDCIGCRRNENTCACSSNEFFERFPHYKEITYKATYKELEGIDIAKWHSPLFMPKEYSRIKLEITNIKVERVQDISEEDAMGEGMRDSRGFNMMPSYTSENHYKLKFKKLWDFIHRKDEFNWELNSWIWAIEFKRI